VADASGGGSGSGGGGSSGNVVSVSPAQPMAGVPVTIQYVPTGRALASASQVYLHLGWNNWSPAVSPDAAMTFNSASNWWQYTVTVTNTATVMNCCFNNGSGTWDNNGGANWNFSVSANPEPPSQPQNPAATPAQTNQINVTWSATPAASGYIVSRDDEQVGVTSGTSYLDTGLLTDSYHCYSVVASNSYGFSTPSVTVCTNSLITNSLVSFFTNGPVIVSPALLVTGNQVTVQYVPTGRDLSSASTVYLHLGWNNWNPTVTPDSAMTLNPSSYWQYTAVIPGTATNMNVCFNNGSGTWDNNSSANWNFAVSANSTPQPPAQPQNLAATPVQTNQINLSWSAVSGASGYIVDRDSTTIASTANTSYSDIGLAASSYHCYSIVASNGVGLSTASVSVCTNTPAAQVVVPPFVLDGAFDYPGYLLASSGMVIYGAVRGTTLYVATWSPGTNGPNDHFIFVSDQLLPSGAPAPWLKAGTVAVSTNKPYLAGESIGNYVSWFVNGFATNWPCVKAYTNSGAMEGTLDLIGAFGYMPTNLYLCAAAYITTNGGPVVSACPPSAGPNIGANGFLEIPVAALQDSLGNGVFNLCDPARGFKLLNAQPMPAGTMLDWTAMPGRSYQVQYVNSLNGVWSNLVGGSNFAVPPLMILNFTDAPPLGAGQRFYRVELLP
jgi:hypothetical protein